MMNKESLGENRDGRDVDAYTLTNSNGMQMRVMTLGGIVTHLYAPDRDGVMDDITLGKPSLEDYLAGHPYFGALVGRVAGRLTQGKFTADGVDYQLPINQSPNHLHGGGENTMDKKVWDAEPLGSNALKLTYRSPEGEAGYPGNVDIQVIYTLNDENEWVLEYEATTDKTTPLSLTNHAYFNLAGEDSLNIQDHVIQINADTRVPVDNDFTLQDRAIPVGTEDFRTPKRLGDALRGLFGQHGSNYLLNDPGKIRWVAKVTEPSTGRVMDVFTDAPDLQFYTGFNLTGDDIGKCGKACPSLAAFCMECQGYPAGVNDCPVESIYLYPGDVYRQHTRYRFTTE